MLEPGQDILEGAGIEFQALVARCDAGDPEQGLGFAAQVAGGRGKRGTGGGQSGSTYQCQCIPACGFHGALPLLMNLYAFSGLQKSARLICARRKEKPAHFLEETGGSIAKTSDA